MDIKDLTYFLTVAQELNISHAANKLHISQPPLSKSIKDLEEELEVILFIRKSGSRQLQLTEAGLQLKDMAFELISLRDKIKQQIKENIREESGVIYIGCIISGTSAMLPEMIKLYYKKYPNVRFDLSFGSGVEVMSQLDKGLIDFAISYSHGNVDVNQYLELYTEKWVVAMPSGIELARSQKNVVSFKDLADTQLILPVQPTRYANIIENFNKAGIQPKIIATYTTSAGIISLVSNGVGAAIVPEPFATLVDPQRIRCKPIVPEIQTTLKIVWKKNPVYSRIIQHFVEFLYETYSQQPKLS